MSSVIKAADFYFERRATDRLPVVVPASIQVGEQSFTAKLANIVCAGAMLETSAPAVPGGRVIVCCGTVAAEAKVVWREAGLIGVKFRTPLRSIDVEEQLSRSAALAARRAPARK